MYNMDKKPQGRCPRMKMTKRIAVLALAAGLAAVPTSCTVHTYGLNYDLKSENGYDYSGCHGVSLVSYLKGNIIVTCEDVDEPEIRIDVDFKGGTEKRCKKEFENLDIQKKNTEDGIIEISFIDKSAGYEAHSSRNIFKEDFEGMLFSHAVANVEMTLPRSYDYFNICNYDGGDIGAKDLAGHIRLASHDNVVAENIAFDSSEDNEIFGSKGIIVSTSRCGDKRANALVLSHDGDIRYVMPEPAELTSRSSPDTIELCVGGGTVTVDLNDNKCADTSWFDKDNKQYRYSVAHGAAMLKADASDDIIFTNGDYQHAER